jgi:hypothetical protein
MKRNTNLNILVRSLIYAALSSKQQDLQQSTLNTTRVLHVSVQISLPKCVDVIII